MNETRATTGGHAVLLDPLEHEEIWILDGDPSEEYFHNMSAPPRTKVQLVQKPVSGRAVVFDLAHALVARGVLDAPKPWRDLDLAAAQELARERWNGSVRDLCRDIDPDDEALAGAPGFLGKGAVLGWAPTWDEARKNEHYQLCLDLRLTLSVLARRVGDLLLLARTPDPCWERCFGPPFALDDERLARLCTEPLFRAPQSAPQTAPPAPGEPR